MRNLDDVPSPSDESTVIVGDVINWLLRGAPAAIAIAVLAGIVAFVITSSQPPQYRASISLIAAQPYGGYGNLELVRPPQVAPRVYQAALLDGTILRDAAESVAGRPLSEPELVNFRKHVRTRVENQGTISGIVQIDVTHESPELAATYANAISDQLIEWDRGRSRQVVAGTIAALEESLQQLDSEIAAVTAGEGSAEAQARQVQLATLRAQRAQELESARARTSMVLPVGAIEVISPAVTSGTPVGPRVLFNTFVAIVVGAILGYLAQFLTWAIRAEVGNRQTLERMTGLPVLAVFPKSMKASTRFSGDAGSYLRENVAHITSGSSPTVIGVTSPTSHKEKLHVAETLAQKFSATGQRTLLIDGDLRKAGPGTRKVTKSSQVTGFESYLAEPGTPLRPLVVEIDSTSRFHFVPSRQPVVESSELISYGLVRFLDTIRDRYDVVILDLPPVMAQADAVAASTACTGQIVCVSPSTDRGSLRDALQTLKLASARVLGTVLVGTRRLRSWPVKTQRAAKRSPLSERPPNVIDKGSPQAVARVKTRT